MKKLINCICGQDILVDDLPQHYRNKHVTQTGTRPPEEKQEGVPPASTDSGDAQETRPATV